MTDSESIGFVSAINVVMEGSQVFLDILFSYICSLLGGTLMKTFH